MPSEPIAASELGAPLNGTDVKMFPVSLSMKYSFYREKEDK